jgi:hypothetical protein
MAALRRFDCGSLPFSLIVEDDDRVAYAYLLHNEEIVGDVWLYNGDPAPSDPQWGDPSGAPFLNPQEFVLPFGGPRLEDSRSVRVAWIREEQDLQRGTFHRRYIDCYAGPRL